MEFDETWDSGSMDQLNCSERPEQSTAQELPVYDFNEPNDSPRAYTNSTLKYIHGFPDSGGFFWDSCSSRTFNQYPEPPTPGIQQMPYIYPPTWSQDSGCDSNLSTAQFHQHELPLPNQVKMLDGLGFQQQQYFDFDGYIDPVLLSRPANQTVGHNGKVQQLGFPKEIFSGFHTELSASYQDHHDYSDLKLQHQYLANFPADMNSIFSYQLGQDTTVRQTESPVGQGNRGLGIISGGNNSGIEQERGSVLPNNSGPPAHDVKKNRKEIYPDEASYLGAIGRRVTHERERLTERGAESGCPSSPKQQRVYIDRLIDAMKNTSDVIDKRGKNGGEAISVRKMRDGVWPDAAIEMACWEIFASSVTSPCLIQKG